MIDNQKLKNKELNDDQLNFISGGKQLTFEYVEAFKQMLSEVGFVNKFADHKNQANIMKF